MQPQPRQPMTYTFIALLSHTLRIYRENFLTIIGLVAFVTIPISLLTIIIAPQPLAMIPVNGTLPEGADTAQVLTSLLSFLQLIIITAPLTYLVSESLFNRKLTISEAFSGVSRRFGQIGCGVLLVGFVLAMLTFFVIFLVFSFPPALALAGLIIYIIVAASSLMFPVLTLENIIPTAAVTRSWSLGKRRFWAGLALLLITLAIGFAVSAITAAAVDAFIAAAAPTMNRNLQYLFASIASDVVSIFIVPLSPIAFTLLYYDIRTRTESLGTLLEAPTARPIDIVTPPARFQFDRHDWRNIAFLSIAGLIIGILANDLIQQFIQSITPR